MSIDSYMRTYTQQLHITSYITYINNITSPVGPNGVGAYIACNIRVYNMCPPLGIPHAPSGSSKTSLGGRHLFFFCDIA